MSTTCISRIFYICDLRSGQFWALPIITRHRLGYWRTLECLGGAYHAPPAISRTVVRRESCEAAFESSRQDAPESLK